MFKKIILGVSLFFFPLISFASTYGGNILNLGSCSAKSYDSAPYSCDKAFDGNTATKWSSGDVSNFPQWIKIDLGAGTTKLLNKTSIYSDDLKSFNIQGSNNNTDWTTLYPTQDLPAINTWEDFYSTTTTAYRYFILNFLSRSDSGTNYAEIQEWTGYECTDCGGTSTTSTASSTIGFMSPQLDFMLQLFIEALFAIMGITAGYLIIKRLIKK